MRVLYSTIATHKWIWSGVAACDEAMENCRGFMGGKRSKMYDSGTLPRHDGKSASTSSDVRRIRVLYS
jgi:hypothetical protein